MKPSPLNRAGNRMRPPADGWPGPALFDAGAASSALFADPRLTDRLARRPERPVVWLLSDDKAGHVNQLRGLGERLEALRGARLVWISCRRHRVSWWQALAARPPRIEAPAPDLVIGAGSGTHPLLLACRGFREALTVVLMRPGFPSRWVDLKVIPEHDRPAARGDILATQGALTAVQPNPRLSAARRGLVLLGGHSPHFHWRDDSVLEQLITLLREYPDWRWTVTSSRRTPAPLVARLGDLSAPNCAFITTTTPRWTGCPANCVPIAWPGCRRTVSPCSTNPSPPACPPALWTWPPPARRGWPAASAPCRGAARSGAGGNGRR